MGKGFFHVPIAINEPIKSYAPGSAERENVLKPVSYTHLTLPTIYSV